MILQQTIEAIIFDFDGLILDTETTEYQSWQEMYGELGLELPLTLWQQHIGTLGTFDPYAYLVKLAGRPLNKRTILSRRKQRDEVLLAEQPILPGVEAMLADARRLGLKLAVASSSPHWWVDVNLKKLGLWERFDGVFCQDDVDGRTKPDPAVYLAAVEALAVPANQALALEDSANGVQAAKGAGLYCAAVPNPMTQDLNFDRADIQLTSLAEMTLPQLIAEVLNGRES